jgi:hypothetical protein
MVTAYSPILKLALPVQGELSGTWGDVVNDNITSMVEQAIAGRAVINTWTTNSHTLTTADGTTSESRCAMLEFTDTGTALSGAGTVICPTLSKIYIAKNASGQNVTLKTSGGTGILVPNGRTMFLFCDGTNVVEAVTSTTSLQLGTSTIVTAVLDEDNMASDSATSLATQQSIKAYVDSQVGANNELSEVLANGNTSGANDIIMTSGQKITVDTIDETTAAAGVTIDSVLLKDDGVNATNLEITNIKANDGTAAGSIADSTGVVTVLSSILTTADINGGTADGVIIGGTTPAAATVTNLIANTDLIIAGTTTITAVLDEDNMASDSATALATQQSIKAYVDAQVGTVDTLAEILAIGNTTGGTDIVASTTDKVQFRDAAIYINSSVDGQLDIVADTEIQIAATTIDVNGALDVSGTALVTGVLTTTAATVFNGGFTANAASTITTADNLDTLSLTSTDADADVAPNLRMYRNSGSPADNDQLGKIQFEGRNDNSEDVIYSEIINQIKDASDGTEDGRIALNSMVAGTLRARLDILPTETVFNDGSIDLDFRVESDTNANALFVQGSDGFVGIGTSSPGRTLDVVGTIRADGTSSTFALGGNSSTPSEGVAIHRPAANTMAFVTDSTERVRIDSSGNVLVGKTDTAFGTAGTVIKQTTGVTITRSAGDPLALNRLSTDGEIIGLYKDGAAVGSIGTVSGDLYIGNSTVGLRIDETSTDTISPFNPNTLAVRDAGIDLGYSAGRFKDLYLSGGVSNPAAGGTLTFGTVGTERMRINSSGNVGIGTSTSVANSKLNVTQGITARNDGPSINPYFQSYNANAGADLKTWRFGGDNSGQLIFQTVNDAYSAAATKVTISSSGNVGIGNASPTTALDVTGTVTADGLTVDASEANILGGSGSATTTLIIGSGTNTSGSIHGVQFRDRYGTAGFPDGQIGAFVQAERSGTSGDYDLVLGTTTDNTADAVQRLRISDGGDISFYEDTGTTAKFYWDSSAEGLGIGTSSPAARLDARTTHTSSDVTAANSNSTVIVGNSGVGNGIYNAIKFAGNQQDMYIMSFNNSTQASRRLGFFVGSVAGDAVADERLSIMGDGNVGIGTSSPANLLHLYKASGGNYSIIENTSGKAAFGVGSGGEVTISAESATNVIRFLNNSGATERMRIDASGNVLVGTSSQIGSEKFGILTTGTGVFAHWKSTGTSGNPQVFRISTGQLSGGIGSGRFITCDDGGSDKFFVTGAGVVNAASATITTISDQRLKENIRDLDDGLEKVLALKPRKFDWKENKGENIKNARGFIAQELELVFPDMISNWTDEPPEGEEPYKAVNANLIPTLVKAIQEQQAIITALETRLSALEG